MTNETTTQTARNICRSSAGLRASQLDSLRTLLVLETANGIGGFWGHGACYRSLELRGLVVSRLVGAPTNRGGGWVRRSYALTGEGRAIAASQKAVR